MSVKGFEKELEELLNKYNKDNELNTPDFILSQFVSTILNAYGVAVNHCDLLAEGRRVAMLKREKKRANDKNVY